MSENQATYSPEDNKLRLYVGRVPRDEYLKLRAEGWTSTPKQSCDFVATWTPSRRDTCLEYAGVILDEDQSPEERAADRAERFSGYRDKRTAEATGRADNYESGPGAFGFQDPAKAERAAAKFDRLAVKACDAWDKAEYWQRRTAGVISHALHKSSPGVRMGRIKELEAALRKLESDIESHNNRVKAWRHIASIEDPEKQDKQARLLVGAVSFHSSYKSPVTGADTDLYYLLDRKEVTGAEAAALYLSDHSEWTTEDSEWAKHLNLRLAYENQMLEAQGGRAAFVEMVPGGWIGSRQIHKVNKSPVTGRVVSVEVKGTHTVFTKESGYKVQETRPCRVILNIERLSKEAYRPPTDEELAAFKEAKAAAKAAAPKKPECPLINPTKEEAEKLQALWNERAAEQRKTQKDYAYMGDFKPAKVTYITQAVYSANSKGTYARAEARQLHKHGILGEAASNLWTRGAMEREKMRGPALCKIRICSGVTDQWPYVESVIVITDKPQKPLPASIWDDCKPEQKPEQKPDSLEKYWSESAGQSVLDSYAQATVKELGD